MKKRKIYRQNETKKKERKKPENNKPNQQKQRIKTTKIVRNKQTQKDTYGIKKETIMKEK